MVSGLNVHGVGVELLAAGASSERTVAELREDFAFFISSRALSSAAIRIELTGQAWRGGSPARSLPVFRTRLCEVRELRWGRRWCGYGEGNAVEVRSACGDQPRIFRVFAQSPEVEHELAYLALLSAVGEELDLLGYHRVHALGIAHAGRASLVLLPRGGGKSAMALLGAAAGSFRVYSDENPLLRDGLVYPYPVRAALAPTVAEALAIRRPFRVFRRLAFPEKRLFAWEASAIAQDPLPLAQVYLGTVGGKRSGQIRPLGRAKALPELTEALLVGRGLAQMAEHMLRPENIARLLKISASRLRELTRLAEKSRLWRFGGGRDAHANLAALLSHLG